MADEDREVLVGNFQDVCACDAATARNCLERCDWQLEFAVQEFLNFQDGRASIFSQESDENQANRETELRRRNVNGNDEQQAAGPSASRAAIGPVNRWRRGPPGGIRGVVAPMGWVEWGWALLTMPFRFTLITIFDLLNFFYGLFFRRPLAVTDPEGDVREFTRVYEAKYGVEHPPFYTGSYSTALSDAKRELRYLLVYLHSDQHQDTDGFCQHTLGSRELIEFISSRNIIFWACSVKSSEGNRGRFSHQTRIVPPFVFE